MIVLILVLTGTLLMLIRNPAYYSHSDGPRPFRAALVDEVSATIADPYFLQNVTDTLRSVGYTVDYYGPRAVTVDLFKTLPSKGYGIVILREHSTGLTGGVIALVTSEVFDPSKYVSEQEAGLVLEATIGSNSTAYFAITPTFIREATQGIFPNTIIVATGCAGLADSEMAQAFISRGAKVYISWDQVVFANQSDGGAILLIRSMTSGYRVDQAVVTATENSPLSSEYPSQLRYYPLDKGGVVLSLRPP
jgi:hypothetical protein